MLSPRKVLSDGKLAASVAGAVAVLGAGDVQAAPIYSGIQDVAIDLDNTVDFDLNGDSVIDYAFQNLFNAGSGFQELSLLASGSNLAVTFLGQPVALGPGTALPGGQKFEAPSIPLQTSEVGSAGWASAPNAYLGLSFDISGATHYGWARLTVNDDTTGTLHDWAYESSPGAAISTGQTVPEPGTLALLALGAAGVGVMRQRRKRQDEAPLASDQN